MYRMERWVFANLIQFVNLIVLNSSNPKTKLPPPPNNDGISCVLLLMEEILHDLGFKQNLQNMGLSYQPQLMIAGFLASTVLENTMNMKALRPIMGYNH